VDLDGEKTTTVLELEALNELLEELEKALAVLLRLSEPPRHLRHLRAWQRASDRAYAALLKSRSR
jgi:hypothetical protein